MRTQPTRRNVLALIASLVPATAVAEYPDRPIKLVVALAPGGPADTAARLFAPYLSDRLAQSAPAPRAWLAPKLWCAHRPTATRYSSARARASRSIPR